MIGTIFSTLEFNLYLRTGLLEVPGEAATACCWLSADPTGPRDLLAIWETNGDTIPDKRLALSVSTARRSLGVNFRSSSNILILLMYRIHVL